MSGFLAGTFATIVTLPIFALIVFYFIAKAVTRNNKRSFHLAIDSSTLFFILAVHYIIIIIWETSLLSVILTVLLIMATVMVLTHYKLKEEIHFKKVFKGFWRLNFLLFFLAYFCLMTFGIIKRVFDAFA
ncbi:DUF3397 domain-containing protein [Sutcliffiella horikoshii]|uniref:DUF3397 domain-containing protein n=1 Tax=Sutcliffiella horikoshii TaxID=79883 RepID=A0AA95B9C5_9BACI|nr:DUF3397 domain-containing protein [Sutcliffiella horikoshii]TYS61506.1 DUF3397 domain-containing protein [Sutcliffiella horikoshii]